MPWRARFRVQQISDQLKRCSSLKEVESWYGLLLKCSAAQDPFLMNQYITACSKFHGLDSAVLAFVHTRNPNVFVYNAVISAFVNCTRPLEGLQYYLLMVRNGVRPSSYTFPVVIKSCRVLCFVKLGECVHGQIWKTGLALHVHVQTALVDFYSNLGRVVESRKVFDEMPERDHFAWCAMISAYARASDLTSAMKVFVEMPERNNTVAWNTMINEYAAAGDVDSAEALFNRMVTKDVISWTTMINCYCKHKRYGEALELFDKMKSSGIQPDEVTISTVISACAHLGALEQGKAMHLYVMQTRPCIDVYTGSALVDMYAKCGALDRALVVFSNLPEKNIVCWSSVIDGLAFHGHAKEALLMFDKMLETIEPNSAVFVSVLTACTHSGMVEEGKRRFNQMTSKYLILPNIEHYGCMVDLLCRVGLLEEALGLITRMRMQSNSVIWGALLGGCRIHKNLEIARIAAERLRALEPNNSGYYTLWINMFAEANRWSDVARIRATMRERGVEKTSPGSSWIEVNKKVHLFAASDHHHPASTEIYSALDVLDLQLKLYGDSPYLEFACNRVQVF